MQQIVIQWVFTAKNKEFSATILKERQVGRCSPVERWMGQKNCAIHVTKLQKNKGQQQAATKTPHI